MTPAAVAARAVALALPAVVSAAFGVAACSAFDDDGSSPGLDASVDAAPDVVVAADAGDGGGSVQDAGDGDGGDGGFPTIGCAGRRCKAKTAACCLYFDKGTVDSVQSECVGAGSECPAKVTDGGASETVLKIGCDDPGDCDPGLVCCHYSASACTSEALRSGVCVTPENCRTCAPDGGIGYQACDPGTSGQCGDAGRTCTRRLAVGPYDYCSL